MHVPTLISRKRDGLELTAADLRSLVDGCTTGAVPDYQMAAFLMAVFFRGMTASELASWTDAMLHSGTVLDLSGIAGFKVDKHSTGGVGDKISLPLAPLVAAAGVPVPMISGRGLGHTGGTLDKLESIPGFRTDLTIDRFRDLVGSLGCGLIGQTAEIAPADKKLYALRDVTATVECIPLIASSILSKKLAEGIDGLVLDVKTGSGAFMQRPEDARHLAETMVGIGRSAGKKVVALLTDMNQPLGNTIGNAIEVAESIEVLSGGGPRDVRELTLELGVEMLLLAGAETDGTSARARLERHLTDGSALERFRRIVEAQGGDPRAIDDATLLPSAARAETLCADRDGFVTGFQCDDVGRAAMLLGAGRARKEDAVDPAVGITLHRKQGDPVQSGEPLATLHVNREDGLDAARTLLAASIRIDEAPVLPGPLVLERIG